MTPLTLTLTLGVNISPRIHLPLSKSRSSPFMSPLSVSRLKVISPSQRCICRADVLQEAPFSMAIAASIFNTLLFTPSHAVDADHPSTDARFAVMTIISFIPFFNWLSWVFAFMDTGKPRFAVYTLVYLAPYFRTNLSLSPDDSWLPIASILLCIIHIQLEASIASGDLETFNFFNEIGKRLGFINLKKDIQSNSLRKKHEEERRQNNMKLPSGQRQSSDELRKWRMRRKPSEDVEHVNEDTNLDDGTKH